MLARKWKPSGLRTRSRRNRTTHRLRAATRCVFEGLEQRRLLSGGDFSLDFVAAAPFTYDHSTGGGAFDDRTIGKTLDVVESLEGGDFACDDIVTYLVQVRVNSGAVGAQTIDLDFSFLAVTTGQPGVGHKDIVNVAVNYGSVVGGDGPGGTDSGIVDDGGSVATLVSETLPSNPFNNGTTNLLGTVRITDLEASEKVVLRIDVSLGCIVGTRPTGNLQAAITAARVFAPTPDTISVGMQTVPFKQAGEIAQPSILVDKTGDTLGKVTDDVDYTLKVTNTGNVPLYPQSLTDSLLGTLSASSFTESLTNDNILEVGEMWTLDTKRTVLATDPDPLVNTFTAVFDTSSNLNGSEVSGSDSHSTELFNADINIVKTSDKLEAFVGETVTYTYTVTNANNGAATLPSLENVVVVDDNATADNGDDFSPLFISGDTNNNGKLDLTETWTYRATRVISIFDPAVIRNVATVTATVSAVASTGFDGGNVVEDDAFAEVNNLGIRAGLGRMTGGGTVFLPQGGIGGPAGTRIHHGFQLHCTTDANNRLEVNWGKPNQHFHLLSLTSVQCFDHPLINQAPPVAPIDTLVAVGAGRFTGTFNGVRYLKAPATISFIFIDAGEPGTSDTASFIIKVNSGPVVLNTGDNNGVRTLDDLLLTPNGQINLTRGNHQAHNEIKRLTNAAATIQKQIDQVFSQLDNASLSEDKIISLTNQLLDLFAQQEAALLA